MKKRAVGYFPCNGRHVLHVLDIRLYRNELRDFAIELILKKNVLPPSQNNYDSCFPRNNFN
jgi:hypothetical protein